MFVTPKWDPRQGHYTIDMTDDYKNATSEYLLISRDSLGSTTFSDLDELHNTTDQVINTLIQEGARNKWFSKLPSNEQLMKRIRHTFVRLATENDTKAGLSAILMTPKILTFVWTPMAKPVVIEMADKEISTEAPPLYFEDSDSDAGTEPELQESALPPVALRDTVQESHEEYLLTRLRAAKARVEAEKMRMQYFETTGRMPPDSESDDEDE
jgi:hypothetical protein